jgi:hypothetical protein
MRRCEECKQADKVVLWGRVHVRGTSLAMWLAIVLAAAAVYASYLSWRSMNEALVRHGLMPRPGGFDLVCRELLSTAGLVAIVYIGTTGSLHNKHTAPERRQRAWLFTFARMAAVGVGQFLLYLGLMRLAHLVLR